MQAWNAGSEAFLYDENKKTFFSEILDTCIHRWYALPPINKYDGSADSSDYIMVFKSMTHVVRLSGLAKCLLFPSTLAIPTSNWFLHLRSSGIHSLAQLCVEFKNYFFTSRIHAMLASELRNIKQGPSKSLRSYVRWFNKEPTRACVADVSSSVLALCSGVR